jgi:hypothetical protein
VFRPDSSLRELVKVLFPAVYKQDEENERNFYAARGIPLKPTYAREEELERLARKPARATFNAEASNPLGVQSAASYSHKKKLLLSIIIADHRRRRG